MKRLLFMIIGLSLVLCACSSSSNTTSEETSDDSSNKTSETTTNNNTSTTRGSVSSFSSGGDIYFDIPSGFRITSAAHNNSLSINNGDISMRYKHSDEYEDGLSSWKKVRYDKKTDNTEKYKDLTIQENKTITVRNKEVQYTAVTYYDTVTNEYYTNVFAYQELDLEGFYGLNCQISQYVEDKDSQKTPEELVKLAYDLDISQDE